MSLALLKVLISQIPALRLLCLPGYRYLPPGVAFLSRPLGPRGH